MNSLSKRIYIFLSFFFLSSCAKTLEERVQYVENFANKKGFIKEIVRGGDFQLTTFQKITNPALPFVFYIEGDGYAFTKYEGPSTNPTPTYEFVFRLASQDDRPNIIYLARPCQYTPMELNPKCTTSYWTGKRMSEEVVYSINEVIKSINNREPISLVGYSGGGGVAILIAARNKLVKDVLTIAANLDHIEFIEHHRKRPQYSRIKQMIDSLNPIDYAKKLNNLPQLHLSGGKDEIVPPLIAKKYVEVSNSSCVAQKIFPSFEHLKGWEKEWKKILTLPISCNNNINLILN